MKKPTSKEIKEARINAGLTQKEAAELIYRSKRSWQNWEQSINSMDIAFFELFMMKIKNDKKYNNDK